MEENLPIDIHFGKLLDWLINRRHCQAQWQNAVIPIREKINNALTDMPATDEITSLLQGTHINYFHCLHIVELLKKTTESNAKDIFGRYSSKRIKEWTEILKSYEKDCVYLAEASQLLARYVNYEIPAFKKQIAKCVQTQDECTRKEADYARTSAEMREKFHSSCKQMNIEGKNIKRELADLVRNMPATYSELAEQTRRLVPAVNYYKEFVNFMLGKSTACLPVVQHVIDKGNTTVHEWKTGIVPSHVEVTELDLGLSDDEEEAKDSDNEIDWGNIDNEGNIDGISAAEINVESIGEVQADIDWSAVEELEDNIEIEVISEDSGTKTGNDSNEMVRGTDALSVLDNVKTRSAFLDELCELEMFLSQRVEELSAVDRGSSSVLISAILEKAPLSVHLDRSSVESLLTTVSTLVSRFTTGRMRELALIRNSPRYVNRLVGNLKKISSDADKLMSTSRLMVIRREEAHTEQRETEPKLELVRQKTKKLQKLIEGEISKKYKNRRVNIMGEINTV